MLSANTTNQLERYDKKRRYKKKISKGETLIDIIKKRKLRLFGHICRMDNSRLIKHTIFAKIDKKSRRGRPCKELLDDIIEWSGHSGQDLFHLAQDRGLWKKLVRTMVDPDGQ